VRNYKFNVNWLKIHKLIGFRLHKGCWAISTVSGRNQSNCYCGWLTIKLIKFNRYVIKLIKNVTFLILTLPIKYAGKVYWNYKTYYWNCKTYFETLERKGPSAVGFVGFCWGGKWLPLNWCSFISSCICILQLQVMLSINYIHNVFFSFSQLGLFKLLCYYIMNSQ